MTAPATPPVSSGTSAPPPSRPSRGPRVEAHGIDVIGEDERHGRARDLFGVWAAPNVSYLSLVVGGALVLSGLSLLQALAVIVVGNLCWALVGLVAVSGPAAGAPSEVIMRAMFGTRGNRVVIGLNGWLVSVCYVALSWSAASVTAFSLCSRLGLELNTLGKVLVIVAIAAATLVISVYGHSVIVRLYLPLAIVTTAVFLVLGGFLIRHTAWSYQPPAPLHGVALWAALAGGVALVASASLSYNNSADFARYLPRDTKPFAVAAWTAAGAFLPSIVFTALGAFAATTLDMSDPQTALESVLPPWFTPLFLIAVILGAIANNAMTVYSSGLALQAIGVRLRRSRSVLLDGTAGVLLTLYALLVSDFLKAVNDMMQLMVVVLGPMMAIYATDLLLRRNRYDGHALADERRGGPFWYVGGVHWPGIAALVLGAAASASCLVLPGMYTGFLASAAGGIDFSLPAGMLLAAAVYLLTGRPPGHRLTSTVKDIMHLLVNDSDPHARGISRGAQLREGLTDALELYLRWFATLGIPEQQTRTDALRLLDNVAAWRSPYADEIAGIAAGAGIELWQAAALNGRTEIIAAAPKTQPECSTLVHVPGSGSPFGVQTWDWHTELSECWHTQEVRGTRYAFAGITEHGILGKIGVNSAGLGLFFNILGHQDDSAAGVPVHVLAAAVLGEAGSVAEALDLLRTATIRTSGAFTLLDPSTAVCAELSPAGVTILDPEAGFLVHTNHFLDPSAAAREKRGLFEPDSQLRHALITTRLQDYPTPAHAVDLVAYLRSGPGEPKLCCVPDPDAEFGDRWATLATVLIEPAAQTVRVHAGSPNTLAGWRTFAAAETVVAR